MSSFAFKPEKMKCMLETPWELAAPAFRVFGNLYFVGNQDGASWLLDTSDGLILFDTNYPTAASLLLDSIWSLGFNPRDIIAIFHTHGHFDHFGATNLIKALSGAKTYLSQIDAQVFLEQPELALLEDSGYPYLKLFTPDVTVHDNQELRFGDTVIRCVTCPGHTPGTTSYFFNISDGQQTLRAGLHGGAGLNTLCEEFRQTYGIDWREDFLASIEKVYHEQVDVFLGNHTAQNDALTKYRHYLQTGENKFVDPTAWAAFLDFIRNLYDQMTEEELQGSIG